MTQHDADEGFHEIQLSGKQLVFAFMAATVVAVAIFLTGVQVGRAAKPEHTADATDASASAAVPLPTASVPSRPAPQAGPPAAEPPAPAPEEDLSYAKRLQGDAPPDKLKPRTEPAAIAPPVKNAPAVIAPAPKAAARVGSPAAPAASPAAPASAGQPGKWIVQVTALQDRAAAASFAHQLASKGYPAFVQDPAPGSPVIYRVQIGGYAERAQAEEASQRLEKQEQRKSIIRAR